MKQGAMHESQQTPQTEETEHSDITHWAYHTSYIKELSEKDFFKK